MLLYDVCEFGLEPTSIHTQKSILLTQTSLAKTNNRARPQNVCYDVVSLYNYTIVYM
jgi:hypothetical protein